MYPKIAESSNGNRVGRPINNVLVCISFVSRDMNHELWTTNYARSSKGI